MEDSTSLHSPLVAGLGVDIVEIDRFERVLARHPRLKQRLFSEDERWYCEHKANPAVHYALRFAAKEAVLKVLGTGFAGIKFSDVEVTHDSKGKPLPLLTGAARQRADELGIIETHLSLSYTHKTAVASAVAVTERALPPKPDKISTKEELARTFKELRGMLDHVQDSLSALDLDVAEVELVEGVSMDNKDCVMIDDGEKKKRETETDV